MADGIEAAGAGGKFERFNALVDNGWLGVLTELELKVLLAYERHAKQDGSDAFPKPEKVAGHLGHANTGHLRVIRKRLEQYGLIRRVVRAGGRDWARVQLLVPPRGAKAAYLARRAAAKAPTPVRSGPPTPVQIGPPTPARSGPPSPVRIGPGPDRTGQGGRIWTGHPGPDARAPYKEEQNHEQNNEQNPLTPAAEAPGEAAARPRRRRPRVLTDDQQQTRIAFSDWWMSAAWPRFHEGATYGFEGERDGPAVLRLLRHPKVKWELERAKAIALYYLQLRDGYLVHAGKPLPTLAARVNYYASKLDQVSQQGASHVIGISGAPADACGASDTYAVPSGRRARLPYAGDGSAGPPAAAAAG